MAVAIFCKFFVQAAASAGSDDGLYSLVFTAGEVVFGGETESVFNSCAPAMTQVPMPTIGIRNLIRIFITLASGFVNARSPISDKTPRHSSLGLVAPTQSRR